MSGSGMCPCGPGAEYAACCGVHHAGVPAPTAEALMRSRYSAYALGLTAYVAATWHPDTRPADLDGKPADRAAPDADGKPADRAAPGGEDDGAAVAAGVRWRRLQIVDVVAGGADDETGIVEFRASYRTDAGAGLLHERSRFARVDGRWVYVDGDVLAE